MSATFLAAIDGAYRRLGYDHRAQFIRGAVREKLQSMGYVVPLEGSLAPDRAGKRGRYPASRSSLALNAQSDAAKMKGRLEPAAKTKRWPKHHPPSLPKEAK